MNIDVDVLLAKISKYEDNLNWVNEAIKYGDKEMLHGLVSLRWRYRATIYVLKQELEHLYGGMPLPAEVTTIFSGHTHT